MAVKNYSSLTCAVALCGLSAGVLLCPSPSNALAFSATQTAVKKPFALKVGGWELRRIGKHIASAVPVLSTPMMSEPLRLTLAMILVALGAAALVLLGTLHEEQKKRVVSLKMEVKEGRAALARAEELADQLAEARSELVLHKASTKASALALALAKTINKVDARTSFFKLSEAFGEWKRDARTAAEAQAASKKAAFMTIEKRISDDVLRTQILGSINVNTGRNSGLYHPRA